MKNRLRFENKFKTYESRCILKFGISRLCSQNLLCTMIVPQENFVLFNHETDIVSGTLLTFHTSLFNFHID